MQNSVKFPNFELKYPNWLLWQTPVKFESLKHVNSFKGMDSEPHKTPYVYVKYHHKFVPGTRECISGLLRKIFVFKVGKPSFFPASE